MSGSLEWRVTLDLTDRVRRCSSHRRLARADRMVMLRRDRGRGRGRNPAPGRGRIPPPIHSRKADNIPQMAQKPELEVAWPVTVPDSGLLLQLTADISSETLLGIVATAWDDH